MGLIKENQIDFKENGGHNHDGTDDNGAIIRSEAPLSDTDDLKGELLKYYGFKISSTLWHICRYNISTFEVVYAKSEDNLSLTYAQAWLAHETLTYAAWMI